MYYAIEGTTELSILSEIMKPSALKDRIIRKLGKPIITSSDVHPGDVAPVAALSRSGQESVFPMIWGIPNRGVIQYQIPETAASRLYPDSWEFRRCVILSSYYYQKPDNPEDSYLYAVQPKGSFVCFIAGLYVLPEDGFPRFLVLTRKATEDTDNLSSQMPVILKDASQWINKNCPPERILRQKPPRMLYVRTTARERTYFA